MARCRLPNRCLPSLSPMLQFWDSAFCVGSHALPLHALACTSSTSLYIRALEAAHHGQQAKCNSTSWSRYLKVFREIRKMSILPPNRTRPQSSTYDLLNYHGRNARPAPWQVSVLLSCADLQHRMNHD